MHMHSSVYSVMDTQTAEADRFHNVKTSLATSREDTGARRDWLLAVHVHRRIKAFKLGHNRKIKLVLVSN